MSAKRTLLFPVEIMNRELDFRLFLAVLCAKPGNRVVVGQHDALFRLARHLRGAVYVGKNIFNRSKFPETDLTRYRALKRSRSVLVHLHEEGAFYFGGREDWGPVLRRRLDPTFLESDDHVCTWGSFQRDYYRSLSPRCGANIQATGHPRFDLLKPAYRAYFDEDAAALRRRLGEFILVNTNLAYANNALGIPDLFSKRFGYFVSDPARRTQYLSLWAHHANVLGHFVRLIDALSQAFPDRAVVVRPHPAEDHGFYRTVFNGVDNIRVLHEGAVFPWLLACGAMIHNGCTTGVEAHFAGTPTISFNPVPEPSCQVELPGLVGAPCRSVEDAVAQAGAALAGGRTPAANEAFTAAASDVLLNLRENAFERVAGVVERAEEQLAGPAPAEHRVAYRLRELAHRSAVGAKRVVRPLFRDKARQYEFWTGAGMFYGLDAGTIGRKLDRIQRMLGLAVDWRLMSRELLSVELRGNGQA